MQLVQAGRIELALSKVAAARAYVNQARRLVPAAHDPLGTGFVYAGLGNISCQQERWEVARRYYRQARAMYGQVYNDRGLLPIEITIAKMTNRLGTASSR